MSSMFKKVLALASLSLSVWSGSAMAELNIDYGQAFSSQFIFLGDSLTDDGNNPFYGRYAPDGPMWGEYFSQHLRGHLRDARASAHGGLNFAYEGMKVREQEVFFAQQAFSGQVSKDGIVFLFLGSNDLLDILRSVQRSPLLAPILIDQGTKEAVHDYDHLLQYLMENGFHIFFVANIPDIGKTPSAKAGGAVAEQVASLTSDEFNARLGALLNDKYGDANIGTLDIHGLFDEMFADHDAFGIKYVDGFACQPGTRARDCIEKYPGALADFLFADEVHPTTKVEKIMGDYAFSVLLAPLEIGTLPMMQLASENMATTMLSHTTSLFDGAQPGEMHYALSSGYYSYDAPSPSDIVVKKNSAQYRGRISMLVDKALTHADHLGLFAQMSFGHGELFGHMSYRMSDYMVGMYYQWMMRRLRMSLSVGLGVTNFPYVARYFDLGITSRIEKGSTFGYHGYSELRGDLPLLHRQHYDVDFFSTLSGHIERVRGYAEQGARSSTMRFDFQEQQYFLGSVGLAWHGHMMWRGRSLKPELATSWIHNFRNTPPVTRASLVMFPHWFWLPAFGYQRDQVLVSAGLSTHWNRHLLVRVDVDKYLKTSLVDPTGINLSLIYKF